MNLDEAQKSVNLNIELSNEQDFIDKNIDSKIEKYSNEHIILLKAFYDLSKESIDISKKSGCYEPKLITYNDIISKINNIKELILNICWQDLKHDGFIMEIELCKYAICPLGVAFIEKLLED